MCHLVRLSLGLVLVACAMVLATDEEYGYFAPTP